MWEPLSGKEGKNFTSMSTGPGAPERVSPAPGGRPAVLELPGLQGYISLIP